MSTLAPVLIPLLDEVEDGDYVSARWPGDAYLFARRFGARLVADLLGTLHDRVQTSASNSSTNPSLR